jgi:hypothetical protein
MGFLGGLGGFDVFVLSPMKSSPTSFSLTLKDHRISYFWNFSFRLPADGKKKKKEMFVISPKVFGIPCTGEYGSTGVPIVGENPGHSVGDVGFLYFVLCVKKKYLNIT